MTTIRISALLSQLQDMHEAGRPLYREDVEQVIKVLGHQGGNGVKDVMLQPVLSRGPGRQISPRSVAQKKYVEAIHRNDIVFGIGPAGTGKTYLAMATAVSALMERKVKRIVLCRPAVEAGEKLGFLPGDLAEKVNPYLRPLYDALHDMMDDDKAALLIEQGTIEVAPLAFMRGRTLNDAFAILDEAQNSTVEQMKMFLTRLGYSSKAVGAHPRPPPAVGHRGDRVRRVQRRRRRPPSARGGSDSGLRARAADRPEVDPFSGAGFFSPPTGECRTPSPPSRSLRSPRLPAVRFEPRARRGRRSSRSAQVPAPMRAG